jgi:hypothetical protein
LLQHPFWGSACIKLLEAELVVGALWWSSSYGLLVLTDVGRVSGLHVEGCHTPHTAHSATSRKRLCHTSWLVAPSIERSGMRCSPRFDLHPTPRMMMLTLQTGGRRLNNPPSRALQGNLIVDPAHGVEDLEESQRNHLWQHSAFYSLVDGQDQRWVAHVGRGGGSRCSAAPLG